MAEDLPLLTAVRQLVGRSSCRIDRVTTVYTKIGQALRPKRVDVTL